MLTYKQLTVNEIDTIKPLWDKLSAYHTGVSEYFRSDFEEDQYSRRKEIIKKKEHVQITMAFYHKKPVGYLIASVDGNEGEIDSLYVDTHYRGSEIGDELMTRSLTWIKSFEPKSIKVSVAYGNQVLAFYEKYGFFPRSIILKENGGVSDEYSDK